MAMQREDLYVEGPQEMTAYSHGLIWEAIEGVGAQKVVLESLSQGRAVPLVALVLEREAHKSSFWDTRVFAIWETD